MLGHRRRGKKRSAREGWKVRRREKRKRRNEGGIREKGTDRKEGTVLEWIKRLRSG